MIVLDTNVISELMRPEPHPGVRAWLGSQQPEMLFTTSLNQTEILYGIAAMPDGRRRQMLAETVAVMFAEDFAGRVLSYTSNAASHYADIVMRRRQAGNPIEAFDALIAATARAAGAAVATRDIGGFDGCDLTLIDPWHLA